MYFCNGLRPDDTVKRSGRYNRICYDSHSVTNDFEFNPSERTLHIVDGEYIVFCLSEFGFYGDVQFDCITCGDFMILKLLDGEVYIKGEQGVVLGVDADGTVEAIEEEAGSAIKWYTTRDFENILSNTVKYNYGLPDTFKGCEFIRNNLVITVECAVKVYKTKDSAQNCAHMQPLLLEAMPGYDIDKEVEKAKGTKTYLEQMQERYAQSQARYLAEQAAKAAAGEGDDTESDEENKGTKKVKKTKVKTTIVKTRSSTKRKKHDAFFDEDSDEPDEVPEYGYEDDDLDYEAGDFDGDDDYNEFDSDDIREVELEIRMKQANNREYMDSEDM